MSITTALDFLQKTDGSTIPPLCVLTGDELFLRSQALGKFRELVLSNEEAKFSFTRFDGTTTSFIDVLRETSTMIMFGTGKRLVLVEQADSFMSQNKEQLESYLDEPGKAGILILQLDSFPSNLRLYKKVSTQGLIVDCKGLSRKETVIWLNDWSLSHCNVTATRDAVEALVELIGNDLGTLDQETRRLSLLVPEGRKMDLEFIQTHVGAWRPKKVWDLVDAALEGRTTDALKQLDKLLMGGEFPIALLAQIASSLRKLSAATHLLSESNVSHSPRNISTVLDQVGVRSFVKAKTMEQFKRLGLQRGKILSDLLLQTDINLKGGSRCDPRLILERFIVQISSLDMRSSK